MSWFWYRGRRQEQQAVADWNAPLPSLSSGDEQRLEALYAWERRLRGYDLFPEPVALEPAFVPYLPDGEEGSWDHPEGGWTGVPQPRDGREEEEPQLFLALRLPLEQKVVPAQAGEFLSALRALRHPVSLEIIADERSIRYQIACAPEDGAAIVAACGHCFPLARLEGLAEARLGDARSGSLGEDAIMEALGPLAEGPADYRVVDFGLYHPAYRPLRLVESFAADPHAPLVNALGSLQPGEMAVLQLLLSPARSHWANSLALLVAQFDGVTKPAHPNTRDNDLERSLRYKLASPLWAVALRVFAVSATNASATNDNDLVNGKSAVLGERAFAICRRIGFALEAAGDDNDNRLVALDDSGYGSRNQLRDLLDRRSRRTGMLLAQGELVGLWHPPSERIVHPRLVRYDPRYRELPDYLRDAPGVALGVLEQLATGGASGESAQIVRWPDAMRNRHLYMLGATRMGKSTLLLNLIAQDLLAGRGLCLIDPHGDLALDVLRRVPKEREADVLYLDLSDTSHPPALGLLEAGSEWEQRLLVSDLLAILHRLFASSWGDRLEHILRHALLTLLSAKSSPFGTPLSLRDIRPLLASKRYREKLLSQVPDPDLHTFWGSEFPGYTASAFAPVYNKLGLLLSSPVVRNIIGGSETKLHAGDLMRNRRVLLVNLAQSLIGEDNAHFLGALLVSKIQLAAMHSLRLGREDRMPFTLYVDEFQNFVVSSFEKILSEAGKAGLTLVMANQFLEQLGEGLPTAIRSNTGTLISFRVSAQSGRALEGEFGGLFGAKELTDLERGQAVARLGRAGDSFLVHTFPPIEPETLGADSRAPERVREHTYKTVCRAREDVEAELRESDSALRALLEEAAQAEQKPKPSEKAAKGKPTKSVPAEEKSAKASLAKEKSAKEKEEVAAEAREAKPKKSASVGTTRRRAVTRRQAAAGSDPTSVPATPRGTIPVGTGGRRRVKPLDETAQSVAEPGNQLREQAEVAPDQDAGYGAGRGVAEDQAAAESRAAAPRAAARERRRPSGAKARQRRRRGPSATHLTTQEPLESADASGTTAIVLSPRQGQTPPQVPSHSFVPQPAASLVTPSATSPPTTPSVSLAPSGALTEEATQSPQEAASPTWESEPGMKSKAEAGSGGETMLPEPTDGIVLEMTDTGEPLFFGLPEESVEPAEEGATEEEPGRAGRAHDAGGQPPAEPLSNA